jgi:hypothetical protein
MKQGDKLMGQHQYYPEIAVFKGLLQTNPSFTTAEKQIMLALEQQARQ